MSHLGHNCKSSRVVQKRLALKATPVGVPWVAPDTCDCDMAILLLILVIFGEQLCIWLVLTLVDWPITSETHQLEFLHRLPGRICNAAPYSYTSWLLVPCVCTHIRCDKATEFPAIRYATDLTSLWAKRGRSILLGVRFILESRAYASRWA